jgi:hypothetical protein
MEREMSHSAKTHAEPPEAPAIQRKFHLYRFQYICIPLLFLVPILAILGVLGENRAQVEQSNDSLEIMIDYPARYHHQMMSRMSISIQNRTEERLDSVVVSISRSYIEQFSSISFLPSVAEITEDSYVMQLEDMAAGEIRTITIELEAHVYGEHTALVTAISDEDDPLHLTIKTLVFP